MKWLIVFGFCHTLLMLSSAEKILFLFPLATKSHANVFEPLIKALAARGHDLNVITPVKSKTVKQNINEISPISVSDFIQEWKDPFQMRREGKLKSMAFFDITNILLLCDKIYENPEFQNFINQNTT